MTDRYEKIPVSVVVPVKNEALAIERCLRGLAEFDEVVVLDSNSSDSTQQIAKDAGASVVSFTWNGAYPKKKQWALDQLNLRNPWVLFIDADETPSLRLILELRQMTNSHEIDRHVAYDIALDYHFLGKRLRHGHTVTKRALVRRGYVEFPDVGDIHAPGMGEQEGHYQPRPNGSVGRCLGTIAHDDPDPFSSWIARHNRYSDWEAHLEAHPEIGANVQQLRSDRGRRYRTTPLKPIAFFMYAYFLRAGFLDGRAGFHYALAHAFYYWQISVKQYENSRSAAHDR